ncbi:MAG: YfhO family protein [Vicinamibacteria bacterium]
MKGGIAETMRRLSSRKGAGLMAMAFVFFCFEFALRSSVLLGVTALYQRDLFLLYFPLVQTVLHVLSQGALPLRDPSSAFGQPLLGDPSCQILYPPVAIHLLLPPHQAYAWFVSLHSIFGAVGVALLARRFASGSMTAGFVSGFAWLSSGPLQSMATLWHHQAGAAWIPWVLLGVNRVVDRGGLKLQLALGVTFGAQILAGSADMCAMTLLLCVLFVPLRRHLDLWKTWLVSGLVALSLSAGMWLPASELVMYSSRTALPEALRTYWSLHPLSALEIFLPIPVRAFPLLPEWSHVLYEGREPFLGSMFLGVAVLPLVLAAFADAAVPRRVRLASAIGTISAFLIALGKHAAFYSIAVLLVPPLKIFRFPTKAMVPFAVLMCVLAGIGAASIGRSSRARRAAFAGVVLGTLLTLFWFAPFGPLATIFLDVSSSGPLHDFLAQARPHLWFSILLLGVTAAWLRFPAGKVGTTLGLLLLAGHLEQSYERHAGFNPTVPADLLAYRPEALEASKPPDAGRLYVYDYAMIQGRGQKYLGSEDLSGGRSLKGFQPDAANALASYAYLMPLTGAFWGVEYAWDADLRQLFDRRLSELTVGLRRVEETPAFLKLLRISGVSRVAARHDLGFEDFRLLARVNVYYPDEMRIFEVPSPLPRAFLVSGRRRGTGSDLSDLVDSTFNPSTTVLVDGGAVREPQRNFEGSAHLDHRTADRLIVSTEANGDSFLVILEGAMPGWRAWVDGQPAVVERANAIFVGTEIPAGRHTVELRFLPTTAVAGLAVTGLTVLLLLLWFFANASGRARPTTTAPSVQV